MSETRVSEVVQGINDELAVLVDMIGQIEKDLEPILAPAPPTEAGVGSDEKETGVMLVNELIGIKHSVTVRTTLLAHIKDRLSL